MQNQINQKVVGATIVGFALVAGAYTLSNFGTPVQTTQIANIQSAAPTQRVAIAVTDDDNNGIEDWRDEFVSVEPVILDKASSANDTVPDTLTSKMSINLLKNVISSKNNGPFGKTQAEIVNQAVSLASEGMTLKLYDVPDINVMENWDDQDIINYGNTLGATIMRYNNSNSAGELEILKDIMASSDPDRMSELDSLVNTYRSYRDDTLNTPVPALLVKEHLDLINTFNAIKQDIEGMTLAFSDPAVTLLHLKRYQDDATGLAYAMQNMFFALKPYGGKFKPDDPASIFIVFSPDYQI